MSVNEKMTAIADAIRDKTKGTESLTLDDMATEIPKVYEAGKQAEQDELWEQFQDGGKEKSYYYAFAYKRFNDETYNPKYDIRIGNGTTPGRDVFYNSAITDTKVNIYANSSSLYQCFYGAVLLETIRLLSVYETTSLDQTFPSCESLKNITIEGVIGQNIDIHWSPLTTESIVNIIEHLSTTSSGKTLTLNTSAVNAMTFPYTSTESGVTYNGWDELIGTRSNWTISKSS